MNVKEKVKPLNRTKRDMLDELMDKEDIDEMSLLDLIFIEEILNQKRKDRVH